MSWLPTTFWWNVWWFPSFHLHFYLIIWTTCWLIRSPWSQVVPIELLAGLQMCLLTLTWWMSYVKLMKLDWSFQRLFPVAWKMHKISDIFDFFFSIFTTGTTHFPTASPWWREPELKPASRRRLWSRSFQLTINSPFSWITPSWKCGLEQLSSSPMTF